MWEDYRPDILLTFKNHYSKFLFTAMHIFFIHFLFWLGWKEKAFYEYL